jgi:hypothetical protein
MKKLQNLVCLAKHALLNNINKHLKKKYLLNLATPVLDAKIIFKGYNKITN